jgi:regulator of sigma E protease
VPLVAFIVILCAMIVIHEFGHFIVAKILGIAVETFSVGFGPKLFGFKIGDTDYRLSAIPLGGYVKFRGENLELLQGKSEGSIDEFLSHPKWKRFLVAIAGPAFNIATALIIPAAGIMIGFQDRPENVQQPVIGRVLPGSAAETAGLHPGDRIVAHHGRENPTWTDIRMDVMLHPNEDIPMKIVRNNQVVDLTLRPHGKPYEREIVGEAGIEPYIALQHVNVYHVAKDSPAQKAGLKVGDKILAINGIPITAWHIFRDGLRTSNGQPVNLKIERGQELIEISAAPIMQDREYKLGFDPGLYVTVKTNSVVEALRYGLDYNLMWLRLTGVAFKQIFTGRRSATESLSGPVRIAQETINTYEAFGWSGTIKLMGMLSLNLGIVNLLPIPVLDGGVILLLIIEWLLGLVGLTLTMNVRERFQQVGFVMVLLLMGFVFVNDFVKLGRDYFSKPPAQEQPLQPGK